MNYFLTSNFFEIFKENPIAIKCIIAPTIIAVIKSSDTIHVIRKVTSEGTVITSAIIVPFRITSCFVSLEFFLSVSSDNRKIVKIHNKNQIFLLCFNQICSNNFKDKLEIFNSKHKKIIFYFNSTSV